MRRRALLSLIAFVVVIVVLIGARYQWGRTHRSVRMATTSQQDSLRRDSLANQRNPADTMCFASKLGLPCDQH